MGAAFLIVATLSGAPQPWAGTWWGESDRELLAQFGGHATILPRPLDFGDSYAQVVLRDVAFGGVRLIAFFQMDKTTGGLKRIQLERPRHGLNPAAFRGVLAALAAAYGIPDAACAMMPGPNNGYQAAAERVWLRDGVDIRAVFRDTTLEALEGCLGESLGPRVCGLTGQLLIRISPPKADGARCPAPPPRR